MDFNILHTVLLVIILLFIFDIICCHYEIDGFDKRDGFPRVYDVSRYLVLFGLGNKILFTIGLDIL